MSSFNNTTSTTVQTMYFDRPIQSSILLVITIFSIPCFIFVLYHFLTSRTLYRALNNHSIILLLASNSIQTVIDVPMRLAYYYTSIIWPPTLSYCFFFNFMDFNMFTTTFLLLTWASFERHILIFHAQLYNIHRRRLIYHYIPLGFCWVYPFVYYVGFIFFYPCDNYYDVKTAYCIVTCYLWVSPVMALYEQIVHGFAPLVLIFIFNFSLIIRVFQHKRKMKQQNIWVKNRKMTMQLISICCLFFITNGGYFTIQIVRMLSDDETFGKSVSAWIFPLSMCMPPLMSFICLSSLPDLKNKFKRLNQWKIRTFVVPINAPLR